MTRGHSSLAVCCLLAVVFIASPLHAQFSGAIEGSVTDQSGAAVPGANVVLTGADTGVAHSTVTSGEGYFRFPSLAPGGYKLTVTAQGFGSVTQKNIELTAMRVQTVPVKMQVASAQTSVEVTAPPPSIELDEAKISSVTTAREVQELPLEGRNIYNVVAQTPGVTGTGLMGQPDLDIFFATTVPAINANGQPNSGNSYYLDGSSLNDSPSEGDAKLVPNPDSIQEVVVSTTNYAAQYGKGSSVVTLITSKSGTNMFHGSLYEYHRDNKLTARNIFQNTPNPITGHILNPFRRNEFGGSLGGPIKKDSTFFFFSWDQVRATNSDAFASTAETSDFVNFMKTNFPNNISTSLLTKFTPVVNGLNSFQTVAQVELAQTGQTCSGTGPLGMPCDMNLLATGVHSFSTIHNGLQWNTRIDHSFANSKDRIYGNVYRTTLDTSGGETVRPTFNIVIPQHALFIGLNWTHVFSPSLLNEAAGGFTRTTALIPCNLCQILPMSVNGMPGFGDGFAPATFAQNDFHWRDMASFIHGKHSLKAGFEIFHNQDFAPFTPVFSRPNYNFETVFDFAADTPTQQGGINFDPRTGGPENGSRYNVSSTYGFFAQDNWKVTSTFTANLGLRWDFSSNPTETQGLISVLKPGTGSTLQQQITGLAVGPAKQYFQDHKIYYFAPRFGFAWQPFAARNWSVRGGFGIFFNRGGNDVWSDTTRNNPPFGASLTADVHVPSGPQPVYGFCASDKFPFNCPIPSLSPGQFNERGGPLGAQVDIGGPVPGLRQAYAENWFLGVQRSFGHNWIAEADYTGSTGVHLYSIIDRNRFAGGRDPVTGIVTRLNSFFGRINYADNSNHSSFNGGTFLVRKRFDAGYSFQVAFTRGKTIDLLGGAPGCNKCSENANVFDAYNINFQRGLSDQDVSKQLSFNFTWDIPKPKTGKAIVDRILGGWELSSLASFQSGLPKTVFASTSATDFNLDGNNFDVPDTPAFGHSKSGLSRSDYLKGVFTASDFPAPPLGQEGNLGRNTFRGPGFAQLDLSVAKNNRLPWFSSEGANLQIRGEFFNLFNRVNLTNWDTNLASGTFGKATGVLQPRTIQVSARLTF